MGPQIPVGVNPQKPFANRREDGCLRDGVGTEIMQLHPVEMQNRPHKTTRWHSEPPLMERDETQHIPRRRGWGGSARRGHPLRLRVTREGTKQAIGNKGLQIVHRDGRERPRVARRDDGHPIGHHQAKEVAVERTRCTAFFLWLFPSGCGNLSERRAARVKNRHRSLFRIYKGLGETRSTLRPNPPRNSKLKGEMPCDRTSQVIRPTYSCPCLTDIRHPVDVPKSLDKLGIFPYLTRNVSPVLQTLQNIGDKEMRKQLHNLTFISKASLSYFITDQS
jgi:hypothetical protein